MFSIVYPSPLGPLTLGSDGENLTGLWLPEQKYFPKTPMEPRSNISVFAQAANWLDSYFAGEEPDPGELPLAPAGSDFRRLIWDLLLDIPYGELTTYGQLADKAARRMGRYSMSAQAVGGAVGHNPISIIIPCHRVVGADGSLTGYAGGISAKSWLLQHEGVGAR